ncbi:mesoderm posterior protein 1 [Nycticebus coucang]|uniref:mesoderm posterior protein 1 n=1 Tax=Nycticebus coucang TaxID=9470 RepID=UPI00234CA502|nr:mesoderm posterior protein 1 [Nycticebus coucang]
MRTLARALHELRSFLPRSVAPTGQSLTKIQTLRLATCYVGHLSAVLGLSEESLQCRCRRHRDVAFTRSCPLCWDGGSAQAQVQVLCSGLSSAAEVGESWGCPPACFGAQVAPKPRDLLVLYVPATYCEGLTVEPCPSPLLFSGDVLALLDTWMPLSPLEWLLA